MDIFDQVCDIIRENMGFEEDAVFTEEMTFEEMALDSLDVVDTVMSIEDALDVKIEDEELYSCKTLGELVEIIKIKKGM